MVQGSNNAEESCEPRRGARLAIVVHGRRRIPRIDDVMGFIALETMGEAVIENARAFTEPANRNPFPLLYRRRTVRPIQFWRNRRTRGDHDRPR